MATDYILINHENLKGQAVKQLVLGADQLLVQLETWVPTFGGMIDGGFPANNDASKYKMFSDLVGVQGETVDNYTKSRMIFQAIHGLYIGFNVETRTGLYNDIRSLANKLR